MSGIKKVLFTAWGSIGGADQVVHSLAKGLYERDIQSSILMPDYESRNGNSILIQSNGRANYGPVEKLAKDLDKDYDIFHAHECYYPRENFETVRQKAGNPPLVYTVHGLIVHEILNNPANVGLIQWANSLPPEERRERLQGDLGIGTLANQLDRFNSSDSMIFLTNYGRSMFEGYYRNMDLSNGTVIGNGSDMHKYASDWRVGRKTRKIRNRIAKCVGKESKIILYAGRIREDKGIKELGMAFDKLSEKHDCTLMIVGEGDMKPILDNVRPQYRSHVLSSGWISDRRTMAAYYKAADVFVLPSYHESFSLGIMEAAMMGTPVIASNVDGTSEVYVKPMYVYDVLPRDVDAIVHWADFLFSNPAVAEENAARVQNAVTERHSLDKMVDRTLELYEHVKSG